ncbi:MAG: ERCC4 domain-containing protein, partial [Candidatus Diapherotrites archaeon]|nr:ERCC4 domain-containing protein [Candidatus Diapherotrites archaeon]
QFSRKRLIALQLTVRQNLARYGKAQPHLYSAISKIAALMKVHHALELVETQGLLAAQEYFERMKEKSLGTESTKADKSLMNSAHVIRAQAVLEKSLNENVSNPKIVELKKIIQEQFTQNSKSRILVFNQYRDNLSHIVQELENIKGVNACAFIGQASKGKTKGLSQKKQVQILNEFKEGDINVLVSTSVGEEGLDVPACDLVVFFEPVASEVRWIQRRGRTGRTESGKTIVLAAKDTRDIAYLWSALKKEKKMIKELKGMSSNKTQPLEIARPSLKREQQTTLQKFKEKSEEETVLIYADSREQGSEVLRKLKELNCRLEIKQLEVGDFILSNQICVERKSVEDFLQSMIDGRLFNQLANMSANYENPLFLIEGSLDDLYTLRDIHKNAIIGAITSIAVRYRFPILFTRNAGETAEFLTVIAKREQLGKDKDIKLRVGRAGFTLPEQQQFIIESLPLIGPKTAKELLKKFGSVKEVVNASEKELQTVENLGEIKAEKIRKVLDAKYKEEK